MDVVAVLSKRVLFRAVRQGMAFEGEGCVEMCSSVAKMKCML